MENKSTTFLAMIGTALLLCLVMNKDTNQTATEKKNGKSYEQYTRNKREKRYDYSCDRSRDTSVSFDVGYNWSNKNRDYAFSFSYGTPRPVYRPVYSVVTQRYVVEPVVTTHYYL